MTLDVPDPDGPQSLRVVLVERDTTTRDFLRALLEDAQMEVAAVAGTAEALAAVQSQGVDVVLAPFPGGDGAGLTAAIREEAGLAFLPIVYLATAAEAPMRYRAIATGADEVLLKPVDPALLVAAIRARVARARLLQRPASSEEDTELRGGQLRRGEFLAQLGTALRGGSRRWQVLMALRLDQNQQMADQLGQAASFELEQELASRFADALQPTDAYTLWMEFGFGLLAARDSREEIEALASELCARIAAAPFAVRGKEYALTLSVGVALPPAGNDAGDPDRWFASAYAAQAIAHRVGGNRFDGVLSREYNMPPERVLIIREWAKEALSGGNVLIEFQPIVPLKPGAAGLYALDAKLRDYRAPLAGVKRREYLKLAREAGSLSMIDRMGLFNAFEAIDEERASGRDTRVLVPVDLASINDAQMAWLEAELRRRRAHSDSLVIEFEADPALSRPEFATTIARLEAHGVVVAISDLSGSLGRIRQLQKLPAGLLRLPVAAIQGIEDEDFQLLLEPWFESGRGVIADGLEDTEVVPRLSQLNVGYIQGDALAAGGPRLDYQFGLHTA
jgi:DNA-binding response OmpR family regulator/EAL domain-containing protein (putative c-di-GMP-specific phosphodiesterase class I)